MEWRQPCPYGWRRCLVFFLGLLLAEAVHGAGSEAAAPRLVPAEVRVLRQISARLGISNWDFVAGPCDYGGSGVHCDCSFSNGTVCHVTEIFLRGKNFSGELPPHFANLPNLLQLDLSRSLFHGGVPDQWAQMKLQGLSLMGNRLSGPFPMVLTKITTLTNLSIEGNGFYGPIPPEIGHLFQMEKLILSANEFTGPLPTALSLFSNLTDLRISSTNFSGRLPEFWGKLKRLEKLQIEGSFLEGPIPLSLSELKNLSDLRVSDLRGSGSAFPYLIGMQSMRTLVLRKCSISGSIPPYIGTWTKLKHLDLSFNKLSGEIPDSFAKLTGVDYIYLTGNSLTGNIPGWLLTRNKIANLESILDSLQLSDDPDGRECHGVGDGNTLRSSSIYQMLRAKESPASPMSEFVWSSRAPPRVQFFGWLVSRERIQCRSNLVKRKIVPDDLCQVCGNSPETTSHVLLRCGFATEFWRKVGVELDASDEGAMLHRLRRPASLPEEGFNTFLLLCCWQLWKRRNAWVFRDEQASMTTTFRRCREDAMLWKVRFKKRGDEIASAWCSAFSEN